MLHTTTTTTTRRGGRRFVALGALIGMTLGLVGLGVAHAATAGADELCHTVEAVFTPDGAWTRTDAQAQVVLDVNDDGVYTEGVDTHVQWIPLDAAKDQATADRWYAERDAHTDDLGAVIDGWDPNASDAIVWGTPVTYTNGTPHLVRYLGEAYRIDASSPEYRPVLLEAERHWSIRTRCLDLVDTPPPTSVPELPPTTTSSTSTSLTSLPPSTSSTSVAPPTTSTAPPQPDRPELPRTGVSGLTWALAVAGAIIVVCGGVAMLLSWVLARADREIEEGQR